MSHNIMTSASCIYIYMCVCVCVCVCVSVCLYYICFPSILPRHLESTLSAVTLELSGADVTDIEAVLDCCEGPGGPVYGLEREREGPHGAIMHYNLNQINNGPHLEELCHRLVCNVSITFPRCENGCH